MDAHDSEGGVRREVRKSLTGLSRGAGNLAVWIGLRGCGGDGAPAPGSAIPTVHEAPPPRPTPPPPECPAQFLEAPPSSYELQNSLLRARTGPIRYRAGLSAEHDRIHVPTVAYGDFNGDGPGGRAQPIRCGSVSF